MRFAEIRAIVFKEKNKYRSLFEKRSLFQSFQLDFLDSLNSEPIQQI